VGVKELDLRTDELEHLAIVGARDLRCLEVNTQSLFTLTVTDCSKLESRSGELGIDAPSLDKLTCSNMCTLPELQIDAPEVREIGELPLWTHGHSDQISRNQASISILTHCTDIHRLHLHLHVPYVSFISYACSP
jgi:hypothetical protein